MSPFDVPYEMKGSHMADKWNEIGTFVSLTLLQGVVNT
jgi:hypothetical protein